MHRIERDPRLPTEAPSAPDLAALRAEVLSRPLPRHVAVIMDGNGRWAEQRGLPRLAGHREGAASVRDVVRTCRRLGVECLTLYAFSTQNWDRPRDEVEGLMSLLSEFLDGERDELLTNGVRLDAVGDVERLPAFVRLPLQAVRALTAKNTGLTLTLALSYGGREELVHAAREIARAVAAGDLDPEDVDEEALRSRLWAGKLPDPDLVIRTSGEMRISNFLLFHLAYAEIVVTELAWPDFRERELLTALRDFQRRERRFGRTSAQLVAGA